MSKSTEDELSSLHGAIAQVLIDQIKETIVITEEDGAEKEIYTVTPATLGVAIKFLKDNDITASIADDENLGELEEMLQVKREKRGLRLASVSEI
jgi:hypothetical protein